MNIRKIAPANLVILAGGALMLIGSFFAFYEIPVLGGTITVNAWDHGLFLINTLPALLGTFMALQIALVTFGNITMPNRVLGLTWDQFHLVLALQSALLMLAFWAEATPSQLTYGTGFWLMLAGSAALVAGALMRTAASGRRPHAI